jgi:Leucine-rich repeat (LRR) protein
VKDLGGTAETNAKGEIVSLDLSRTWITDGDLRRVGQIPTLQKLDLSHTRITDIGFSHLKNLRNVTHLNLYYARTHRRWRTGRGQELA